MKSTVLILGARGRFGQAAARAFADAGWRVFAHVRPGAQVAQEAALDARIHWVSSELSDTSALAAAAQGASIVVHGINPAYTNKAWTTQSVSLLDASIELARDLDATLMLPGNIYNFGADMPAVLREETPQLASTIKGRVRVAMETRLQRSGVRSVVIRAGDFFGSGKGTMFDTVIVKDIQKGIFTYPGARDVPISWAYLPDLARTFVAVADKRAELKTFEVFHFAGYRITAQRWLDELSPLSRAQGWVKPDAELKFRRLPWPVIRLGGLFVPTLGALVEMRYLWNTPQALANDKLVGLIGTEPHTPLKAAVNTALCDLGIIADKVSAHERPRAVSTGLAQGVIAR